MDLVRNDLDLAGREQYSGLHIPVRAPLAEIVGLPALGDRGRIEAECEYYRPHTQTPKRWNRGPDKDPE
jgi:hypothetical protein